MMWVGSNNGLYRINSRSEIAGEPLNDLDINNAIISDLHYDGESMWIASSAGLCRFDYKSGDITKFTAENGELLNNQMRHINVDPKGNVWILYRYGRASIYHKAEDRFIHLPPTNPNKIAFTSLFFDDDKIFVTTWEHGLIEIVCDEDYSNLEYLHTIKPNKGVVLSIVKDRVYDYYWITTVRGIYVIDKDGNRVKYIRSGFTNTDLSNEEVWCSLYSPGENILWFGTKGGGVNQLSLSTPIVKNNRFDDVRISSNSVSVIYDREDEIWLGMRSVVMAVVDKKSGSLSFIADHPWLKKIDIKANGINVITKIESRNEIWLGSRYGGVWVVSLDDDEQITDVWALRDRCKGYMLTNEIQAIFEDSLGRIFVSCEDGTLAQFTLGGDGRLKERVLNCQREERTMNNMPNYKVVSIAEGAEGEIFFATENDGVWRSVETQDNGKTFHQVDIIDSEKSDIVAINSIYKSSDSTIWLATHNYGLARYNPAKECFEVDRKMLDEGIKSINSIIEDSNGDFWFGSEKGIVWVNTSRDNRMIFNHRDGLSDNIYSNNSVMLDREGRIYYGGHSGYSVIDISSMRHNSISPKPIITDITIFNKSILDADSTGSNVERDEMGNISKLNIKNGDENFVIDFSSLSFQNPSKNRFEYRMVGSEDRWQRAINGDHSARYSNMRSGHYTFELYGYNNYGVRSQEPATLKVHIHPKWYNTTVAWIIWILIPLGIVILVANHIFIRWRYRESLRIARIDKERTEELNSAKLQFFSNVSHEFLTPLTIISCGLDDLKYKKFEGDKLYDIVKGNVSRLLRLTEQILEFRKAETGNLKLQVEYGDLRELIFTIVNDDFLLLINRKNLQLKIDCQITPIYGYFDRDKLSKILYNLLSNACKYNIEGGEIRVTVEVRGAMDSREVVIGVSNTGSVISEEQQKRLFTRFYDGEYRQYKTKGVGIGLSLTRDLVVLHKGDISVSSSQDRGTTFVVVLPLEREAYQEEQNVVGTDVEPTEEINLTDESEDFDLIDDTQYTILLVEDDADCQYVVESLLSREYRVIVANDGKEALALANKYNPDIIISDIIMPKMDGYELCAAIKSDINLSHIPVILLTAKIANESKVEGLGSGAEAYLTKPIELDILSAQIKTLLNGRQIFSQYIRKGTINISPETKYKSESEVFLERAVSIIHDNMSNAEFGCAELQDALFVTRSTLYRKLKVLANMSPIEFIRHIRLLYARDILRDNGEKITISEVAYTTGFGSPRYFSTCFKAEFGISPKQYLATLIQKR
ncbi:MAG: ATP-binding protein [Rikenellaceae bacterium]